MSQFDSTKSVFDFWFNFEQTIEVPFNPAWKNHTGYLDFAVRGKNALKADLSSRNYAKIIGERFKFTDDQNRRGIIVTTPVGNIVVFERYNNGDRGIFVMNSSDGFRMFYLFPTTGNMLPTTIKTILGDPEYFDRKENIGIALQDIGNAIDHYNNDGAEANDNSED